MKSVSKTTSESFLGRPKSVVSVMAVDAGRKYRARIVGGTNVSSSIVVDAGLAGFIVIASPWLWWFFQFDSSTFDIVSIENVSRAELKYCLTES